MSTNPSPNGLQLARDLHRLSPELGHRPPGSIFRNIVARLGRRVAGLLRAAARKRAERRAIAELRGFSDRGLKDLGLGRSQIAYAVRNGRDDGGRCLRASPVGPSESDREFPEAAGSDAAPLTFPPRPLCEYTDIHMRAGGQPWQVTGRR